MCLSVDVWIFCIFECVYWQFNLYSLGAEASILLLFRDIVVHLRMEVCIHHSLYSVFSDLLINLSVHGGILMWTLL